MNIYKYRLTVECKSRLIEVRAKSELHARDKLFTYVQSKHNGQVEINLVNVQYSVKEA